MSVKCPYRQPAKRSTAGIIIAIAAMAALLISVFILSVMLILKQDGSYKRPELISRKIWKGQLLTLRFEINRSIKGTPANYAGVPFFERVLPGFDSYERPVGTCG